MRRCTLDFERGDQVEIVPHDPPNRLFDAFVDRPPESVRLMHVKWSGDAVFFFHDLRSHLEPGGRIGRLEPGSVAYFPDLVEILVSYGVAAPRSKDGEIEVAPIGWIEDLETLGLVGERIWKDGVEEAQVRVF